eukprot:CAMPEP_0185257260 /NCGR_PEP_ID=MMETSP1359-20130426/6321_1 /TAXON_ID=552665 /ORGANISM="Bigelowiella longifila, Strain CCMP242" /LENGTH=63 /DNA_ID=CAMNT_0027842255 /DNA_START=222 /DNA_END=409 /DNA_ORIENTATION=+
MAANIVTATRNGDRSKVLQLLSKRVDIEQRDKDRGSTSLTWASYKGYLDIVKVLLENKANIEA